MTTDGEAWTDNEIAESIPGDTYKNHLALQELLRNKVAKRNELGAVFSKRMVEDERIRQQWKDRQTRHRVTQDVTPMSRPSSSSSSKHKSYGASRLSSKDLQAKAEAQVGSLREISPEQHQENLRIIEELSR